MNTTPEVVSRSTRRRGVSVGRKRTKKFQPGETMPVTFRLDAELAGVMDAEAERLTDELGFVVSRVDVMRRWLKEAADRATKSRK